MIYVNGRYVCKSLDKLRDDANEQGLYVSIIICPVSWFSIKINPKFTILRHNTILSCFVIFYQNKFETQYTTFQHDFVLFRDFPLK